MGSGTVGWFSLTGGTVGIAHGQTLRVSVVNLGPRPCRVSAGLWQNPRASLLAEESFVLEPGESRSTDLPAADIVRESFDKAGRAQVRAIVRSGDPAVSATLEVFDNETGRTGLALPLQELRRPS